MQITCCIAFLTWLENCCLFCAIAYVCLACEVAGSGPSELLKNILSLFEYCPYGFAKALIFGLLSLVFIRANLPIKVENVAL